MRTKRTRQANTILFTIFGIFVSIFNSDFSLMEQKRYVWKKRQNLSPLYRINEWNFRINEWNSVLIKVERRKSQVKL